MLSRHHKNATTVVNSKSTQSTDNKHANLVTLKQDVEKKFEKGPSKFSVIRHKRTATIFPQHVAELSKFKI